MGDRSEETNGTASCSNAERQQLPHGSYGDKPRDRRHLGPIYALARKRVSINIMAPRASYIFPHPAPNATSTTTTSSPTTHIPKHTTPSLCSSGHHSPLNPRTRTRRRAPRPSFPDTPMPPCAIGLRLRPPPATTPSRSQWTRHPRPPGPALRRSALSSRTL